MEYLLRGRVSVSVEQVVVHQHDLWRLALDERQCLGHARFEACELEVVSDQALISSLFATRRRGHYSPSPAPP